MSSNAITWVGLDAHKKSIHVAMLVPGREDTLRWQEANEADCRPARRLQREAPGEVRACYEAGPPGLCPATRARSTGRGLRCGRALRRDSVRQDLMRARHRTSKFLLRPGYRYRDTQRHWGVRHMKWLRPLTFEHAAAQARAPAAASPPSATLDSAPSRRNTVMRARPGTPAQSADIRATRRRSARPSS